MTACRWTGNDSPRVVRGRHLAGCAAENAQEGAGRAAGVGVGVGTSEVEIGAQIGETGCEGCQPCERPHCLVGFYGERGDCQTHAESVCPACLGKVREHLSEIVRLTGLPLVEQVLAGGSVDTEAADLLGPAANPVQWRQRGNHGHIYEPDSRLGWHTHPLSVLGWFDMLVAEHLGHTRTTRITVTRAATYLDTNLTYLAADMEFDFPDLANALAACREHLERVLHDGEQRETGAPCMKCRVPLWLIRDDTDYWQCPRCRQTSTEDQYRFAVMADFVEHSDQLTALQIEEQHGIPASTVRRWCSEVTRYVGGSVKTYPVKLRSTGKNSAGQNLYSVKRVLELREEGRGGAA